MQGSDYYAQCCDKPASKKYNYSVILQQSATKILPDTTNFETSCEVRIRIAPWPD